MHHLFEIIKAAIKKRWSGKLLIKFKYGAINRVERIEKVDIDPDERQPVYLDKNSQN